jgi:hypothetical protein
MPPLEREGKRETGETGEEFDLFNTSILTGLNGLIGLPDHSRCHIEWLIRGKHH